MPRTDFGRRLFVAEIVNVRANSFGLLRLLSRGGTLKLPRSLLGLSLLSLSAISVALWRLPLRFVLAPGVPEQNGSIRNNQSFTPVTRSYLGVPTTAM